VVVDPITASRLPFRLPITGEAGDQSAVDFCFRYSTLTREKVHYRELVHHRPDFDT